MFTEIIHLVSFAPRATKGVNKADDVLLMSSNPKQCWVVTNYM